MSTVLALVVIWTIVAMIFYCCYRLWYWAPIANTVSVEAERETIVPTRRAA